MADALSALNGDLQLLAKVFQMVLNQTDVDLQAIRVDIAAKNTAALCESSHRLKGSLGAIAAMPAYQACTLLNKAARSGAVETYAIRLLQLEHELNRLCPDLRAWLADNRDIFTECP